MKLAIVKSGCFDGAGVSRVIESWARMLGGAGHRVTVVSQAHPRARARPVPGVDTLLYDPPDAEDRRKPLFAEAETVAGLLQGLSARGELDLVIPHTSLLTVYIRRGLPSIPLLQTIHSPSVEEHYLTNWKYARSLTLRLKYPLTRAMLRKFDREALLSINAAHTLSDYTWSLLGARFPRECGNVSWTKIPGTFDHERFVPARDREAVRRELGLRADETILFTVRRLVPRNGVDRILTCAKILGPQLQNTRFLIGGIGELSDELKQRIRSESLGDRVEMLGFVSEERLVKYYQAADVFLLPTRELECFGLPVIEAMACSCPPLVMPHGGPAEVCREFPERIASANTDEAFTELVRRFLSGEMPRQIEGADRWIRERYSEKAVQPAVADLVGRVAKQGGFSDGRSPSSGGSS
jgi:glycosyltransferase involved in cell wall biosynthesis